MWAPPYAQPAARIPQTTFGATAPSRPTSAVGTIALVAGVLAAVIAPLAASVASWQIGVGVGSEQALIPTGAAFDPSVFTPVRDWVLLGEVSFWLGTLFGVWALVQGIVAIAKNRGRGSGVAAVVLAAIGPFVFAIAVAVFLSAGLAAGAGVT